MVTAEGCVFEKFDGEIMLSTEITHHGFISIFLAAQLPLIYDSGGCVTFQLLWSTLETPEVNVNGFITKKKQTNNDITNNITKKIL